MVEVGVYRPVTVPQGVNEFWVRGHGQGCAVIGFAMVNVPRSRTGAETWQRLSRRLWEPGRQGE